MLNTFQQFPKLSNAIIHSDQGYQYTHKKYQELLESLYLCGSHSRKANCLDNACIESFFSRLKTESFYEKKLFTKEETIKLIEKQIYFYNTERFQKRLSQLSSKEFREKLAV